MADEHVRQKVHDAFVNMDVDGDGKVSFSEFNTYCSGVPGMENIPVVFNDTDTDDDFMINEDELLGMITKVPAGKIKECHVRDLFKKIDTSGDGTLSKSEFRKFMMELGYSGDILENTITAVAGDDDMITVDEFLKEWNSLEAQ